MPKALTRLVLALLATSLCAAAAAAQTSMPEWIAVSPSGEGFAALMPKEPLRLEQEVNVDELAAKGQRYTATAGGARYVVWSLNDSRNVFARQKDVSYENWPRAGRMRYLDLVAEAAWELLIEPEFERLDLSGRLGKPNGFAPLMSFQREFELNGRDAREYTLRLEKEGGPVYVCADGPHLYIVAALSTDRKSPDSKRFVESFAVGTQTPNGPAPEAARDVRPPNSGSSGPLKLKPNTGGGDAPVDYERPFTMFAVDKKAVITGKPEPGFTEWARKFEVVGVVRLRAILNKTGKVTNIFVVKPLPHGLTEKSIDAAKKIQFVPAQKDGRTVSQYIVLEYNYNIY